MLHYVPMDPGELAGKEWLWIERPDGERFLLLTTAKEVTLPPCAVMSLARQADERKVS